MNRKWIVMGIKILIIVATIIIEQHAIKELVKITHNDTQYIKTVSIKVGLHGSSGLVNTLRPRQNGHHFADNIFKCIFFNENPWIALKISLKFVPKVRINNVPALVQIMAWRRPGDKPLSEPMMVSFLTHICITRPQWVNDQTCLVWMGYWKMKIYSNCKLNRNSNGHKDPDSSSNLYN